MNITEFFKDFLQKKKMFLTFERKKIIRILDECEGWFSAEDLMSMVKNSGICPAKSTIYRNLELLCVAGVIESKHLPGEKTMFRRYGEGQPVYRLHCRSCNSDHDINDPALERAVIELCHKHGYDTGGMMVKVEVRRRCRTCDNCHCRKKSA